MTARATLPFAAAVFLYRWRCCLPGSGSAGWYSRLSRCGLRCMLNPLFLLHYGLPLAATVAIAIATGAITQSVNQFRGWPADAL